jgi:hypothetical protein
MRVCVCVSVRVCVSPYVCATGVQRQAARVATAFKPDLEAEPVRLCPFLRTLADAPVRRDRLSTAFGQGSVTVVVPRQAARRQDEVVEGSFGFEEAPLRGLQIALRKSEAVSRDLARNKPCVEACSVRYSHDHRESQIGTHRHTQFQACIPP